MWSELSAAVLLAVAAVIFAGPPLASAQLKNQAETGFGQSSAASTCDINGGDNHRACNGQNTSDNLLANDNCFRAAVVNYSPYIYVDDCSTGANENLEVYAKIARIAKENGAQILVFPENGILTGTGDMHPCLEEIPDPKSVTDYNPCLQPDRFGNKKFPILTRLSCLAIDNGLYLVANYGTKQKRKDCPDEDCAHATQIKGAFGQYLMLNTDVVFTPTGLFLGRYRKYHPFVPAESFAKAPELEHVYFDTPFGRFGVFTCFDILYKQPAIDLVEKFNIDTVLFPTHWIDELPLLTAVQIQDGWSSAMQVNLLGSNVLSPHSGATGSGIFSGNTSLYVTPEVGDEPEAAGGSSSKTKVLIRSIKSGKGQTDLQCKADANPKIIEIEDNPRSLPYKALDYPIQMSDTIEALGSPKGSKSLCAGQVCCTINYELDPIESGPNNVANYLERMVILVRDGLRLGGWYEQVCTLGTLVEPYTAAGTTLKFSPWPVASFRNLSIRAEFDTSYVYPLGGRSLMRLVERDQRHVQCQQHATAGPSAPKRHVCELRYVPTVGDSSTPDSNKLYSFGLYGRVYEKDREDLLYEQNVTSHIEGFLFGGSYIPKHPIDYNPNYFILFKWVGIAFALGLIYYLIKMVFFPERSSQLRTATRSQRNDYGTTSTFMQR